MGEEVVGGECKLGKCAFCTFCDPFCVFSVFLDVGDWVSRVELPVPEEPGETVVFWVVSSGFDKFCKS